MKTKQGGHRLQLIQSHRGQSLHTHGMPTFLKPGRDVAMLAAVQIICSLALIRLAPRFLSIHLYQLISYVAILLLIGYGRERWACVAGQ